ncbi:hypothetical protein [Arenibacter palladensis]|uniref:hypothetical protein n=1 Tax=Arenibacter palladensis TaxID=237373 RepID=UPI0026E41DA9|nr:hypothetical protein [Arenibacter palladensis]MDO6602004.1 hypothetical protein [Arenibacter palladensis]
MESKKKQITIEGIITFAGGALNNLGYSNEYIESHYKEWAVEGRESTNDYLWYLYNRELNNVEGLTLEQLYLKQSNIYYAMGIFVLKYENGNRNHYTRLAFKSELLRYIETSRESDYQMEVIIIQGKNCEYVRTLVGQTRTPEEMLDWQPLASKDCTNPNGCNCAYSLVPKRDMNGRLVRKKSID